MFPLCPQMGRMFLLRGFKSLPGVQQLVLFFCVFTTFTPRELGTNFSPQLGSEVGVHCERSCCPPQMLKCQSGLSPGLFPTLH